MADEPEPTLQERRAKQSSHDRTTVEELRDEVANLTNETHRLRGTLGAYARWTDLTPDLDRRMVKVERVLDQRVRERAKVAEADRVGRARGRRSKRMWWVVGVLFLIASSLGRMALDDARDAASFRRAFISSCHQRQQLESVLREGYLAAGSNPATPPERIAELEDLAARLTSPPCEEQFANVTE